jgi:hypothetical protein
MVNFLRGRVSDRKLRLFFCACCRSVWQMLDEPLLRRAVEVAERHADGLADDQQLRAVEREICLGPPFHEGNKAAAAFGAVAGSNFPVWAIDAAASLACSEVARQALGQGRTHIPPGSKKGVRHRQARLLRCIAGWLPFRSVVVPSTVLAWNDGTVKRIAEGIYEERQMPEGTLEDARLDTLADALLDAGCEHEELIQHCRQPGPHYRGCWALDRLLEKE